MTAVHIHAGDHELATFVAGKQERRAGDLLHPAGNCEGQASTMAIATSPAKPLLHSCG